MDRPAVPSSSALVALELAPVARVLRSALVLGDQADRAHVAQCTPRVPSQVVLRPALADVLALVRVLDLVAAPVVVPASVDLALAAVV